MRLSDIQGEQVFDVIAEIIDPIANIAEDEAAAALFKRETLPEGMTAKKFLLSRVRKTLPSLLKSHKRDLIAILSAIEGTDTEEYAAALDFKKLLEDITALLTDEPFMAVFISAQNQTDAASSGFAPETITGPGD